ncbi:hypothetical protein GCM10010124_10940 [Pilimelia terevasa]|uniref:DUF4360 domain-containing protein n=1 Tax=Pilimelia terevasa TaxID=53372 RepID=A0A8J3BMM2_9ACTN|nr:DUF4360 domain-containing protein [Pilimelia terevasa]GGK20155.1 hypothetical protein GCM10010124_10940 [Pilimelia terevasa]
MRVSGTTARVLTVAGGLLLAGTLPAAPARADGSLKVDLVSATGTGCARDAVSMTPDFQQTRFAIKGLQANAASPAVTCVLTLDLTAPKKRRYTVSAATIGGRRVVEAGSTGVARGLAGHEKDRVEFSQAITGGTGAWIKSADLEQRSSGCARTYRYTVDLGLKLDPAKGGDSFTVEDLGLKYLLEDC